MSNEFKYCASLSILHPTYDLETINIDVPGSKPKLVAKTGEFRRNILGEVIVPKRRATRSHLLVQLHSDDLLYSGTYPLSDFLNERLSELAPNRGLFKALHCEGSLSLLMAWHSKSSYMADLISAETLYKCGDLGLSLEFDMFLQANRTE